MPVSLNGGGIVCVPLFARFRVKCSFKCQIMKNGYQSCIEACLQCAAACDYCASSCLNEGKHIEHLAKCIQLDMECAAICRTSAQLMSLQSEHANAICQICADICNACAAECEKHDMDHCRLCAEACRHCAEECSSMVAA